MASSELVEVVSNLTWKEILEREMFLEAAEAEENVVEAHLVGRSMEVMYYQGCRPLFETAAKLALFFFL